MIGATKQRRDQTIVVFREGIHYAPRTAMRHDGPFWREMWMGGPARYPCHSSRLEG
jgi:hypothetical protein